LSSVNNARERARRNLLAELHELRVLEELVVQAQHLDECRALDVAVTVRRLEKDDLVAGAHPREKLRQLNSHVRQRRRVVVQQRDVLGLESVVVLQQAPEPLGVRDAAVQVIPRVRIEVNPYQERAL